MRKMWRIGDNVTKGMNVVDLHNHTHKEALERIEKLCTLIRANIETDASLAPFKIITGRSSIMKDLVIWKIKSNAFEITTLPNHSNPGIIVVTGPKRGTTPSFIEMMNKEMFDLLQSARFEDEDYRAGLFRWCDNVYKTQEEECWHYLSDFDGHQIKPGHLVQVRPSSYKPISHPDLQYEDIDWMHGDEIEEKSKRLTQGSELVVLPRNVQLHQDDPNFDGYECYEYYLSLSLRQTYTVVKIKEGYGADDGNNWIVLQAMDEFGLGKEVWVLPWETRIVRKGV